MIFLQLCEKSVVDISMFFFSLFSSFSGVSFDTSLKDLIGQIPVAMKVFAEGVESFVESLGEEDPESYLIPHLSCDGSSEGDTAYMEGMPKRKDSSWKKGEQFHR